MKEYTLDLETRSSIESVLRKAWSEKRTHLFETEVYDILDLIGISTPMRMKSNISGDFDESRLSEFPGDKVVLKIISSTIFHKGKIGGVRVVGKKVELIRNAIKNMVESLEKNGFTSDQLDGVLITEYVDYSRDLGNEALISFRESFSFGPVVSFSKGGADAEHFAAYYSAPNLILAPMKQDEALNLIQSTKIFRKYMDEGKSARAEIIAEIIYKFGILADLFSSFNSDNPEFIIGEFEVNPFVFDSSGRFIALDGLAGFEKNDSDYTVMSEPNLTNLDVFFKPDGVAVIGVSATNPEKMGNRIARLLIENGREDLFFVNVKGGTLTVDGRVYPLYKSLMDIEKNIDMIVVTVPAKVTIPVIEEALSKGVKGVVLIPGGFSEVGGEGASLEHKIQELVKNSDLRIIGPNCVGVFYSGDNETLPLNTIFIPRERLEFIPKETRNVALITQSGAMGITEVDKLKHAIYPRYLVSYGNQLDVDPGDLVAYFDRDESVDVIAMYVEGFKPYRGREFFEVARKAQKPIIVYKAGRTDAGSRAAASHTSSMTGDYETAKAAFNQAGIIVADTIIDHKDLIMTFALLHDAQVEGRRTAGIVNAGFEGTYAADTLGGLILAELSEETKGKLRSILPPIVSVSSMLDLTPMADDELFARCIEIVMEDSGVDNVFISIVPHTAQLRTGKEDLDDSRGNIAEKIVAIRNSSKKPMVVSVNAGTMYSHLGEILNNGRVPVFPTAERAMECLNRFVDYRFGK